jgi:hypothetical protein
VVEGVDELNDLFSCFFLHISVFGCPMHLFAGKDFFNSCDVGLSYRVVERTVIEISSFYTENVNPKL